MAWAFCVWAAAHCSCLCSLGMSAAVRTVYAVRHNLTAGVVSAIRARQSHRHNYFAACDPRGVFFCYLLPRWSRHGAVTHNKPTQRPPCCELTRWQSSHDLLVKRLCFDFCTYIWCPELLKLNSARTCVSLMLQGCQACNNSSSMCLFMAAANWGCAAFGRPVHCCWVCLRVRGMDQQPHRCVCQPLPCVCHADCPWHCVTGRSLLSWQACGQPGCMPKSLPGFCC